MRPFLKTCVQMDVEYKYPSSANGKYIYVLNRVILWTAHTKKSLYVDEDGGFGKDGTKVVND